MNKRILALLIAVMFILGIVSGCGGTTPSAAGSGSQTSDATTSSDTTSGDTAPSGGFTGDPIWIAVKCPLTGDAAEYGVHYKNGAEIAVEKINAAGGINGRELKVEFYDTKNDPKENAELARLIVQDDKYMIALADYASSGALAALPIYDEAKMVQFCPTASSPQISESSYYSFQMYGLQTEDAPFVARYIIQKHLGYETVGAIYFNTDWGTTALANFERECGDIGVEITNKEAINTGETDFNAILSKIRQSDPDCLYVMANYSEVANIVKQCSQMGWDVQVIPSSTAITSQLTEMLDTELAEGLLSNQPYVLDAADLPLMEYSEVFAERAGIPMSYFSLLVHDTVMCISEGMKRCGDDLSRQSLADELYNTNMDGLLGHFEFDEHGRVHRKYYIVGFKDGAWTKVQGFDFYDA